MNPNQSIASQCYNRQQQQLQQQPIQLPSNQIMRRFRIARNPNLAYTNTNTNTGKVRFLSPRPQQQLQQQIEGSNAFEDQYETIVLEQQRQYNHFAPPSLYNNNLNHRRLIYEQYGASSSTTTPPTTSTPVENGGGTTTTVRGDSETSSSTTSSSPTSSSNTSPISGVFHGVNTSNTNTMVLPGNSQITITTRINNGKLESEV